jgi:hypothetical protein
MFQVKDDRAQINTTGWWLVFEREWSIAIIKAWTMANDNFSKGKIADRTKNDFQIIRQSTDNLTSRDSGDLRSQFRVSSIRGYPINPDGNQDSFLISSSKVNLESEFSFASKSSLQKTVEVISESPVKMPNLQFWETFVNKPSWTSDNSLSIHSIFLYKSICVAHSSIYKCQNPIIESESWENDCLFMNRFLSSQKLENVWMISDR